MDFSPSASQQHWLERVQAFIDSEIVPEIAPVQAEIANATDRWQPSTRVEALKARAHRAGLWNLFLPPSPTHDEEGYAGAGLTNLYYAPCAEAMGRINFASEVFNCSAPDTGNMEVLHRYGDAAQKRRWLAPLLAGEIRYA